MPVALPSLAESERSVVCNSSFRSSTATLVDSPRERERNARKEGRKERRERGGRTRRKEASSGVRDREIPTIASHRRSAVLRGAVRTTSLALRRVVRPETSVSCAGFSPTLSSAARECRPCDFKNVTVRVLAVGWLDGRRRRRASSPARKCSGSETEEERRRCHGERVQRVAAKR